MFHPSIKRLVYGKLSLSWG